MYRLSIAPVDMVSYLDPTLSEGKDLVMYNVEHSLGCADSAIM